MEMAMLHFQTQRYQCSGACQTGPVRVLIDRSSVRTTLDRGLFDFGVLYSDYSNRITR
jgi:hypothetical protein